MRDKSRVKHISHVLKEMINCNTNVYPGSGSIREITHGGFTGSHGGKNCTCKPVKEPVSRKG